MKILYKLLPYISHKNCCTSRMVDYYILDDGIKSKTMPLVGQKYITINKQCNCGLIQILEKICPKEILKNINGNIV